MRPKIHEAKSHLFGASASVKQEAENLVKRYSYHKLDSQIERGKGSIDAIIVSPSPIYDELDRHYVSAILRVTKSLDAKLPRMDNIWVQQQPIYVRNAARSLLWANQRMNNDLSISGEGESRACEFGGMLLNMISSHVKLSILMSARLKQK